MEKQKGRLFLVIAFILAGSSVVSAGFLSDSLMPFTTTFMSLLFAVLTAFAFCGQELLACAPKMSLLQWRMLFLQALFGIFLFRAFLTTGLRYTSAIEAGILTGTAPALTAILSRILLREPLHRRGIGGVCLTLLGVLILQGFPLSLAAFDRGHIAGNLLAVSAAACEALFTVLSRKAHLDAAAHERLKPVLQSGYVSLIALVLCLLPMLWERPLQALLVLSPGGWVALLWYGSIVTVVAFACMFAGAKRCDGYTIASFSGIIPLSSLCLAVLLLGETVTLYQICGCICIVGAVIIIGMDGKPRARP